MRARGNNIADELAKAAMTGRPDPTPLRKLMMRDAWSTAMAVAKHAARASALWPRSRPADGGRWSRHKVAPEEIDARRAAAQAARNQRREEIFQRRAEARATHQWMQWRGVTRCTWCLVSSHSTAAEVRCEGALPAFVALGQEAQSKGHRLWNAAVVDQVGLHTPLAVCIRCGGWAQGIAPGRPPKLSAACTRPTRAGSEVIARVRKGLFPKSDARWRGLTISAAAPWPVG